MTIYQVLKSDIIPITSGVWSESRDTKQIQCNLNKTDSPPPPPPATHTHTLAHKKFAYCTGRLKIINLCMRKM